MRRSIAAIAGVIFLLCAGAVQADVTLGVMANRGEEAATAEWAAFSKYLSAKIGQPVHLVAFPIERTFELVGNRGIDFVITNPAQTAGLEERFDAKPLATWSKDGETAFGGVIILNPKSGIAKAADIKGRKVVAYNTESAGAYIFQRYHMLQAGVDVSKDVRIYFTRTQDDIVRAVRSGEMDVGFVRTGVLESMVAAGRLKMSDVAVLDMVRDPGFAQARTTPLYPDWFLTASPGVDAALAAKVKAAALAVPKGSPAARAAGIDGFVEPLPRDKLVAMLKALRLPPFNNR